MTSRSGAVARLILGDIIGSVFWFPVWWYTTGLGKVISGLQRAIAYRIQSYSFRIWIKNFLVPMYGQYDITGRLVSVFMRFIVLVGRGIALGVEAMIYLAGVIVWVLAPPFIFVMFFLNLTKGNPL